MINMKLEIESENSYILGLAAKTFEILCQCKGYPYGKGCHDCKYGYCKNPDTEPDMGCRIVGVEEVIAKFSF
jgi:hypothetical protein